MKGESIKTSMENADYQASSKIFSSSHLYVKAMKKRKKTSEG
jgi:hypothetical protein